MISYNKWVININQKICCDILSIIDKERRVNTGVYKPKGE